MLAAAKDYDEDFATYLRVLAATGCRRSEALALRWNSIDWERSELLIAHSLTVVDSAVVEKDTKTHQARRVILDPGTVQALDLKKRSDERASACGTKLSDEASFSPRTPTGARPGDPT